MSVHLVNNVHHSLNIINHSCAVSGVNVLVDEYQQFHVVFDHLVGEGWREVEVVVRFE